MERGRKGGVEVQGDKIAIKKGASTFGREKNIIKLSISQAKKCAFIIMFLRHEKKC